MVLSEKECSFKKVFELPCPKHKYKISISDSIESVKSSDALPKRSW